MSVLPRQDLHTSVLVVGPNAAVQTAISRLLSLESGVRILTVQPRAAERGAAIEFPGRDFGSTLSDRQLEVVRLVAEGLSNKEIGFRLRLSDKTVKNHVSHILAKLNLSARTQVAVAALRAGLV
jgi:DNA-binding NarL/FixJ family response regulator